MTIVYNNRISPWALTTCRADAASIVGVGGEGVGAGGEGVGGEGVSVGSEGVGADEVHLALCTQDRHLRCLSNPAPCDPLFFFFFGLLPWPTLLQLVFTCVLHMSVNAAACKMAFATASDMVCCDCRKAHGSAADMMHLHLIHLHVMHVGHLHVMHLFVMSS